MVKDDPEAVEADLAAGLIACPDCHGTLTPWGFSSEREVRTLAAVRRFRPRRTMCSRCGSTHVLEPASTVPRHRDSVEVIGAAWQAKVAGAGHRTIAEQLDRSACTVRRWLCRLSAHADQLRAVGTVWVHALDPGAGRIEPAGSSLADALEAVGLAVAAAAR
jgi:hypothetical protein